MGESKIGAPIGSASSGPGTDDGILFPHSDGVGSKIISYGVRLRLRLNSISD